MHFNICKKFGILSSKRRKHAKIHPGEPSRAAQSRGVEIEARVEPASEGSSADAAVGVRRHSCTGSRQTDWTLSSSRRFLRSPIQPGGIVWIAEDRTRPWAPILLEAEPMGRGGRVDPPRPPSLGLSFQQLGLQTSVYLHS